ncbi:MAG TPA: DUF1360 domain-containing protein [Solirubrobacteraceae bacterium]|jgi:hypothetical protein
MSIFAGYAPSEKPPLAGYATLIGIFTSMVGALSWGAGRTGRRLPERIPAGDLVLLAAATHKASRLIAKDRVTSVLRAPFTSLEGEGGPGEVEEQARGSGLRLAIGELLICPYCLGLWVATGFAAGLVLAPRPTRWIASVLSGVFAADVLQIVYKGLEDTL